MFDTVRAYIKLEQGLDPAIFEGYRAVLDSTKGHEVVRHWLHDDGRADYQPRLDWYHDIGSSGILACTFSVAKMCGDVYGNPSERDVVSVLDAVDAFLRDTLSVRLPSIRSWTVTRVDYAWNFDVQDVNQLRAYLLLVSRARLGAMSRHDYDESGVVWKSGARWVKFYDKALESGRGDARRYLRYEVSNLSSGVGYMCKRWLRCERDVVSVLTERAALLVLDKYLSLLGLDNADVYERSEYTLLQLREVFGSSAMSALTALSLISEHGNEAYKSELMTSSSYYRWKQKLYDAGFLPMSSVSSLRVLSLPCAASIES